MALSRTSSTLLLVVVCLICLATATLASREQFSFDWDPAVFANPQILSSNLTNIINKCGAGKPTQFVLNGGPSLTQFVLSTSLPDTATFFDTACYKDVQKVHPTISGAQSFTGCWSDGNGGYFITGTGPNCPSLPFDTCTVSSSCPTGTTCANRICNVQPKMTVVKYAFDAAPNTAADAKAMYQTVVDHYQNILNTTATPDCASSEPGVNILDIFAYVGKTENNAIYVHINQEGTITAECETAIKALPITPTPEPPAPAPEPPAGEFQLQQTAPTLTGITIEAPVVLTDTACYSTGPGGLVTNLLVAGSCSLSKPLGAPCSKTTDCPGAESMCSSVCLYQSISQFSSYFFYTTTVEFPNQQTTGIHTREAFKKAAANIAECADLASSVPTFGIGAVAGSVTKFDLHMYTKTDAAACLTAINALDLKTVTWTGVTEPKSIVMATETLTALACLSATGTTISATQGSHRCNWRAAVGMDCTMNTDCDQTTSPATTCSASKCTKSDTDPNATTDSRAVWRLDIQANQYLGNEKGAKRLEAYLKGLKNIAGCAWTHASTSVGNAEFTVAHIYLYPFNFATCGLDKVPLALGPANSATLSVDSGDEEEEGGDVVDDLELLSVTMVALNEEEGGESEPTPPPPLPDVRLMNVQIKRATRLLPEECLVVNSAEIECSASNSLCDIPCPFAHACGRHADCGSFGLCGETTKKCEQLGTAPTGIVNYNAASTNTMTFAAVLSVIVALVAMI